MNRPSILSSVVLLVCLAAFAFGTVASAATYYVATNGNDNDDGSFDYPWATFAHAVPQLNPGDTLYLKDGTYYDSLQIDAAVSGTEAAPITIAALNDGQAIVDGEGSRRPCRTGDYSVGPHDLIIEGIRFQNSNEHVIHISNSNRITLRRVSAYNAGKTSQNYHVIHPTYSTNILLEDCVASGTGRTMIMCWICENVTFRRCFAYWTNHGQTPFYDFGIYNSDYCLMENCVGTMDQSTSLEAWGVVMRSSTERCDYNEVYGNVIYNMNNYPWSIESDNNVVTGNRLDHNVVINEDNTLDPWCYFWVVCDNDLLIDHQTTVGSYGAPALRWDYNGYGGGHESGWDPDITLKNSVFLTGEYGVWAADDPTPTNFHNTYNDYWDFDISPWGGDASQGTGEIEVDPGFDTTTYGKGGYLFVPDGSPVKSAGEGGTQMGAEVLYRYVDGVLTSDPLWPWPMEDRIQEETEEILGTRVSVTWENKDGATGGLWKTLDGIYGPPVPPTAEFSGNPTSGYVPLTVHFTDLSSGSPTSWDWTFGDGGSSQERHPSHEYTAVDSYTVSLTATNAQGQDTETKVDYITVSEAPPQSCHVGAIDLVGKYWGTGAPSGRGYYAEATITVHDQDCAVFPGVTVDITWSGCVSGTDSGVTGDNGQVMFESPKNTEGGTFTCCVDNLTKSGYPYQPGDNHETCDSITNPGGAQPPVADFEGSPLTGGAPLTVNFTDQSTESPTSWSWTFGDGGTSGAQNPSHEYTTANTYTVSLEACNAEGCDTETKTDYITVTGPQPPVADFSGNPLSGDVPLTVNFTDSSTNTPTSWSWTFGDGGTDSVQNPSHQYTVANTYTVSLEACNGAGCDTETKPDYISATEPSAPVADFSGSPLSGYAPLDVDFTDLSTENPTSWSWTFGDGGTSGAQNPSHQYTAVNTYTVSLEACNAAGCDTETKVDYIDVQEQPSQSCHVGAIDLADDGTPKYKANATITAHDQDCAVLPGVTVTVQWYWEDSPTGDPQSDVTDGNGQVTFVSPRHNRGTFKCCVTNMEKTGYPYQSGDNHETCDSLYVP